MLGALALVTVLVQPGQTLSGIAASHGVSLASVERANPQITNPDLIFVGQNVRITGGSAWTPSSDSSSASPSPAPSYSSSPSSSSSSSVSSSGYHIPGMSDSMASCIAFRESRNGAASSNVFQIMPGSGHSVAGMSLSQQEQVAGQIVTAQGVGAWTKYDGC